MTIKAIFSDLDGTFLDSDGEIPAKNLEMVQKIIKENPGTIVAFTTGTGPQRAIKYAQACGIDQQAEQYMICYNGGAIIKLSKGEQQVIWRQSLSLEQGQYVIAIAKKYDAELQVYNVDDEKVLWLKNIEKFNANKLIQTPQDAMKQDYLYKGLLFFKQENDRIDEIINELRKDYPEFEVTRSRLSRSHDLFKTHPNAPGISIEINPKGVDKGEAIKKLCEIKRISVETETMACGDEMNDLTMLQTVGCSVYVDNANPQIKATAKFPTSSNNDSGFAQAVKDYVIEERHLLSQEFYDLVSNYDNLFGDIVTDENINQQEGIFS